MSNKKTIPPVFLVKKEDAEKSDLWNETAKGRFFKQHGDLDAEHLPENDAHAVKKYQDPTFVPPIPAEETKAAEELLEKKIKELKDQGQTPVLADPKKTKEGNFYDEWID